MTIHTCGYASISDELHAVFSNQGILCQTFNVMRRLKSGEDVLVFCEEGAKAGTVLHSYIQTARTRKVPFINCSLDVVLPAEVFTPAVECTEEGVLPTDVVEVARKALEFFCQLEPRVYRTQEILMLTHR